MLRSLLSMNHYVNKETLRYFSLKSQLRRKFYFLCWEKQQTKQKSKPLKQNLLLKVNKILHLKVPRELRIKCLIALAPQMVIVQTLCNAAMNGDLDKINTMLEHGGIKTFINTLNSKGWVSFCSSSSSDDLGQTALHCAAQKGHKSVVNALLTSEHIDIHAVCNGETALHAAVTGNHLGTFLLSTDSTCHHVLYEQLFRSSFPLNLGTTSDMFLDVVVALILKGASVETKNKAGLTPKQLAINNKLDQVAECFQVASEKVFFFFLLMLFIVLIQ